MRRWGPILSIFVCLFFIFSFLLCYVVFSEVFLRTTFSFIAENFSIRFIFGLFFVVVWLIWMGSMNTSKFYASRLSCQSAGTKISLESWHFQLISETVHSIRTVKLSNWEPVMQKRIDELREKEIRYLRGRKYLDAVCVYLWASAPILITISIFFTFTFLMHEKLTTAKVSFHFVF